MRVTASTGARGTPVSHPVATVYSWATRVGSDSQLMILFEPCSAVIQPRPTPAAADTAANTATKVSAPSPAVRRNERQNTGSSAPARWASTSRWIIQIHTEHGRAAPAEAVTVTATA